jgi:NADPH-dependent ferric siderophore reductase
MSETFQTTTVRTARRVRHETKMRLLQVREVSRLTPKMVRVVVGGEALAGFISAAHDDHVKLFFPQPGHDKPVLPTPTPNGPVYPEGAPRPAARDYTPRRYDATANALTIDFVLHGVGPATTWAAQARPGQFLGVGGPRGSFIVPDDFDWYLLAGDETAIPAIGRRLQELPAGTRVIASSKSPMPPKNRNSTRARDWRCTGYTARARRRAIICCCKERSPSWRCRQARAMPGWRRRRARQKHYVAISSTNAACPRTG